MKEKRGISLIVLVITIIVMIVLVGTVIISLNNSGILERSHTSVKQNNLKEVQIIANTYWGDGYVSGLRSASDLNNYVTQKLLATLGASEYAKYNITVTTRGVEVSLNDNGTEVAEEQEISDEVLEEMAYLPVELETDYLKVTVTTTGLPSDIKTNQYTVTCAKGDMVTLPIEEIEGYALQNIRIQKNGADTYETLDATGKTLVNIDVLPETDATVTLDYMTGSTPQNSGGSNNEGESTPVVGISSSSGTVAMTSSNGRRVDITASGPATFTFDVSNIARPGDLVNLRHYTAGGSEMMGEKTVPDTMRVSWTLSSYSEYEVIVTSTRPDWKTTYTHSNAEMAYSYSRSSNTWTGPITENVSSVSGDIVVRFHRTGETTTNEYLQQMGITTPQYAYAMTIEGTGSYGSTVIFNNNNSENITENIDAAYAYHESLLQFFMSNGSMGNYMVLCVTELYVDNGITSLPSRACFLFGSLNKVVLPNNMTSLGTYVFQACTALETLELPTSLSTIPHAMCYNCTSLQSMVIPNGVTIIDDFAFCGCTSLTNIYLPKGLRNLGNFSLSYTAITNVTIPNGCVVGAFQDNPNLQYIKFSGSLNFNSMKYHFRSCNALRELALPTDFSIRTEEQILLMIYQ